MTPYYQQSGVTIYHADCRDLLPSLSADAIVTDPPYGQTSLPWDSWVYDWLTIDVRSMWCFGSLRMFMDHAGEFTAAGWRLAQDVIWEKHNGSSFHADRFKRVHEQPAHFYRGAWEAVYKAIQTTPDATARTVRRKERPPHTGQIAGSSFVSVDGGPRLMRSVIRCRSTHGYAEHETQKPIGILEPLIAYSVPARGIVLDPFAGSGSTAIAARLLGRLEIREECCEIAARRLQQEALPLEFESVGAAAPSEAAEPTP